MKKRKSKSTGLSAPRRTTRKVRIKRRTRRKGMLSEFFTDQSAGRAVLSGAIGGAGATLVDFVAPEQTPLNKGLIKVGMGYVVAKFLGYKNVGAGMAGAGIAQALSSSLGLAEGGGNWAQPIEALPMFMSENNATLSESQANALLSEGYLNANYMPDYALNLDNATNY